VCCFSIIIAGNQRIPGDLFAGPMKLDNGQDSERCASQHGDHDQIEFNYMQPPATAKLIDCQIQHRPMKPCFLLLKILDPPHLICLETTKFFALAVVRNLSHADLVDRSRDCAVPRCQSIELTQLQENLFRLVSLTYFLSTSGSIYMLRPGPLHWGRFTAMGRLRRLRAA